MRTLPNSSEEKTAIPFFIRIKEVPQISERNTRINQARAWLGAGTEVTVGLMAVKFKAPVNLR